MSTSMMMTLFGNKVVRKNDWKWFNCGLINGRRESITPLFLSHTHTLSLCICATPKMFELCWSPNGMGFLPLLSPSRRTNFWAPNENIIQDKKNGLPNSAEWQRLIFLPCNYTYINFTRFNYYVFEQSSQRQYFASFITRRRCHKQILAWLRYAEVKHSDWML